MKYTRKQLLIAGLTATTILIITVAVAVAVYSQSQKASTAAEQKITSYVPDPHLFVSPVVSTVVSQPASATVVLPTVLPQEIAGPVISTANWKTFSSQKYKISFKYPPEYAITDFDNPNNSTLVIKKGDYVIMEIVKTWDAKAEIQNIINGWGKLPSDRIAPAEFPSVTFNNQTYVVYELGFTEGCGGRDSHAAQITKTLHFYFDLDFSGCGSFKNRKFAAGKDEFYKAKSLVKSIEILK